MDKSRKKLINCILETLNVDVITSNRVALMSEFSDAQLCGLLSSTAVEIISADLDVVAKKCDFIRVDKVTIDVKNQRVSVYGKRNRFFKEGDDDPKSYAWRIHKDETYCVPREAEDYETYDVPELEDVIAFRFV